MRQWLNKLMIGRYGSDQFGRFLSVLSLVILIAGMIVRNSVGTVLTALAVGCLVYSYYRMFSKKTNDRYIENVKYLKLKNKITGWFRQKKERLKQRKTFCFFKCPKCGVTVRVPRGKGQIKISCPKCKNTFVKKT